MNQELARSCIQFIQAPLVWCHPPAHNACIWIQKVSTSSSLNKKCSQWHCWHNSTFSTANNWQLLCLSVFAVCNHTLSLGIAPGCCCHFFASTLQKSCILCSLHAIPHETEIWSTVSKQLASPFKIAQSSKQLFPLHWMVARLQQSMFFSMSHTHHTSSVRPNRNTGINSTDLRESTRVLNQQHRVCSLLFFAQFCLKESPNTEDQKLSSNF